MNDNYTIFQTELKKEIQQGGPIFGFQLEESFLNWFIENGKCFEFSHVEILEKIKVQNSTPGNCFHNSQLVSMQNEEIFYFEGIMRGVNKKSIIHHGFNVLNEKVLDVTHINNRENFLEELGDESYYYFGVEISNDYLKKFPDMFRIKYYDNPIILKYYQDTLNT